MLISQTEWRSVQEQHYTPVAGLKSVSLAYGRLWTAANDAMRSAEALRCMPDVAEQMIDDGIAVELSRRIVAARQHYIEAADEVARVHAKAVEELESLYIAYYSVSRLGSKDDHGVVTLAVYETAVEAARRLDIELCAVLAEVCRELLLRRHVIATNARSYAMAEERCSKVSPGRLKGFNSPSLWQGYSFRIGDKCEVVPFEEAIASYFGVCL